MCAAVRPPLAADEGDRRTDRQRVDRNLIAIPPGPRVDLGVSGPDTRSQDMTLI